MEWPLSYVIDAPKRMVFVTYHEQPSFAQWSQTMGRIFEEPDYQPQMGIVLDRRAVFRPAETEYVRQMVRYIDRRRATVGASGWAILVGNLGSYGMGRMAEQLSDCTQSIRTFKRLEEAESWLASFQPGATSAGPCTSTGWSN